jgi:hypothetical protein
MPRASRRDIVARRGERLAVSINRREQRPTAPVGASTALPVSSAGALDLIQLLHQGAHQWPGRVRCEGSDDPPTRPRTAPDLGYAPALMEPTVGISLEPGAEVDQARSCVIVASNITYRASGSRDVELRSLKLPPSSPRTVIVVSSVCR